METHTPEWRPLAACQGRPVDWWIPAVDHLDNTGQPVDTPVRPEARALCASCPVAVECLDFALGFPTQAGLIGGTGPNQRRALRRHRHLRDIAGSRYWAELEAATSETPANVNGSGATCGRTSTYGRNCRCTACRHASAVKWRRDRFAPIDAQPEPVTIAPRRPRRNCGHVDLGECVACAHHRTRTAAA